VVNIQFRRKLFLLLILLPFINSCSTSEITSAFSANLPQDIVTVCKKEYKIDIEAEILGNTLYVYLPLDDIILSTRFLSDESMSKINNVTLAASRAGLSAAPNIKFYKIIASDKKNPGIDFVITRFVLDIKKFMLGAISRKDYIQRMEMNIEFNPTIMGENSVKSFFKDLETAKPSQIIKDYFPNTLSAKKISPTFFAMLMEHSMKINKKNNILQIKSKQISKFKALVHVKVQENYNVNKDYPNHKFQTPSQFVNEYIFVINTALIPKIIESIYSYHTIDQAGTLIDRGMPEALKKYNDTSQWSSDRRNPLNESVPLFVIRQVTKRIKSTFTKDKNLKKLFTTKLVTGKYLKQKDGQRLIQFNINIQRNSTPESLKLLENYHILILNKSLDIITELMKSYEFTDYDRIYVNYAPKKKQIILDKKLVYQFYRHRISVPELLQQSELIQPLSN
jgi:hypothetical protein